MANIHKFRRLDDSALHDYDLDKFNQPDQAICIDVGPLSPRQKAALDNLLRALASPVAGEPAATFALYTRMPGSPPPPPT